LDFDIFLASDPVKKLSEFDHSKKAFQPSFQKPYQHFILTRQIDTGHKQTVRYYPGSFTPITMVKDQFPADNIFLKKVRGFHLRVAAKYKRKVAIFFNSKENPE